MIAYKATRAGVLVEFVASAQHQPDDTVATVRRATTVINLTLGVARADTKRMPISTLPRIFGRAAVKRTERDVV
jgi:hypothetical protein